MKVAIVGAGKLGIKVANALLEGDHEITVIDISEAVLSKISADGRHDCQRQRKKHKIP